MNRPIIINPEAEADLREARSWYESVRAELGDEFIASVEESLHAIQRQPEAHGVVFDELRVTLVRRFPYLVVYRMDTSQITVVAIYHARRDPRGWQVRC